MPNSPDLHDELDAQIAKLRAENIKLVTERERVHAVIRRVLDSNPYNRQQIEFAMEDLANAIGEKVGI